MSPVTSGGRAFPTPTSLPFVEWAGSRRHRLRLMRSSGFPLEDDVSAFLVAYQVARRGALRPSVLAATLEVTPSYIAKSAKRLEAVGLSVRMPDPDDDRAVLVALTPKGRAWAVRVMGIEMDGLLEGWTEAELAVLALLLEKLNTSLRPQMAEDGFE